MIKNSEMKYFEMARAVAMQSDYRNIHVGAVLVYQGRALASGCNSTKTLPLQKSYNRRYRTFRRGTRMIADSQHAEMACINSVPYTVSINVDWKKAKLFIYRISPGSPLGFSLSRPCEACMALIKDKGIRHIYYTTKDGYAYERIV